MRRKIIAGNWKLNKSFAEARQFLEIMQRELANPEYKNLGTFAGPELVIFPQAPLLTLAKDFSCGGRLGFGSQNSYWEEKGAFTGELSLSLVKELSGKWALAGHSERRQFFGETSDTAVKRALFADRQGLRPMLCIGETLAEREAGQTEKVLKEQLAPLFKAEKAGLPSLAIAYEPVWAIGTGLTATTGQVEAVHSFLRLEVANHWGGDNAECLPVLYGGSVKVENSKELLTCPNVDGLLIGGASLEAKAFLTIAANSLQ